MPTSPAVEVELRSEHLRGTRPDGSDVTFRLKAEAQGDDASSLEGNGRHFGSGGVHNHWSVTGSVSGDVVTLTGVTTDSNESFLIGSPVNLVGDASSGSITLAFGPLAGGHFAGQTIVGTGVGTVTINRS
jgi:hypothetical protein